MARNSHRLPVVVVAHRLVRNEPHTTSHQKQDSCSPCCYFGVQKVSWLSHTIAAYSFLDTRRVPQPTVRHTTTPHLVQEEVPRLVVAAAPLLLVSTVATVTTYLRHNFVVAAKIRLPHCHPWYPNRDSPYWYRLRLRENLDPY